MEKMVSFSSRIPMVDAMGIGFPDHRHNLNLSIIEGEKPLDTRHLKIFTTVYKTRSFTRAAEELFTSQPTVSEHMRNLEDKLGCKLFDRLGRSILPTPEAEILYPKAISILQDMDSLTSMLASTAQNVTGELVIGASTIPGEYVLPEFAAQFTNSHPAVSFEIRISDSGQIVKSISNHQLYLGVVGAQLPSSKVEYYPLGGDELVLAVGRDCPLPEKIEKDELKELDFLVREQGSGTGNSIERFLNQVGLSPAELKIRATLGSSSAIKEAIKSGLGSSIISRTAIREELSHGTLRTIEVSGLTMHRSFYIVTAKKRSLPNQYLAFADYLKKMHPTQENGDTR
jgi:DNA-binding transcriptional LysR family regulator